MEIRTEINGFYELEEMCWSGATDTLNDIIDANKEDEFMDFLEMVFCDNVLTNTEVNDFIWFERDYIYEHIGLTENGKLPEDEIDEEALNESIESLENEEEFDDFCDDCDKCIFNEICSIIDNCKILFEGYKNQTFTIDDIKEMWKEKTNMDIFK